MRNKTDLNQVKPSKSQIFIYRTKAGRLFLKLLISRTVSKIAGAYLNSKASKFIIKGFVNKNNIDMSQFENKEFSSYNDFFVRCILPGKRPITDNENELISPADSRVTVYKIDENLRFNIKNSYYNIAQLIDNKELSCEFEGGQLLVFRLCVDDYHRYCYVDDGEITDNYFIKGKLHTVQPIALEKDDFFKENCREITVINSKNFGRIIMIEIGAMMVGKIVNHQKRGRIKKGEEKGYFEFGGSTVCVLLKKNAVKIDDEIIENTKNNYETQVQYGETIGKK